MDKSPINRQEYYAALGRLVVSANHLEHWMRTCLLIILGEETFRFLYAWSATDNFDRILQLLQFSFSYRVSDTTRKDRFASICERIRELYKERNNYIHSFWLFAKDNSFVQRTRNLKGFRIELDVQPDLAALNKLADDLGTAHKDLLSFINQVFPTWGTTTRTANEAKSDSQLDKRK